MTTPAAARIRPLLPRTPGMPISPANVVTQGRKAPVIMTAPAATPLSPTAPRQLRRALIGVAVVRAGSRTASMDWLTMGGPSRVGVWRVGEWADGTAGRPGGQRGPGGQAGSRGAGRTQGSGAASTGGAT